MMKIKTKNVMVVALVGSLLLGFSAWSWCKPNDAYSDSERRNLALMPQINLNTLENGGFSSDFEKYAQDQFPLRDAFRRLKALFSYHVLGKADNNGIYLKDGYLSKIEYPIQEKMLDYAATKFQYINEQYLDATNKVYFSIIPDKNYVLAEQNGYLSMDYPAFINQMVSKVPDMNYIDITKQLSLTDFYQTDTHWKQDQIVDIANQLTRAMGSKPYTDYVVNKATDSFCGVYCGQSALKVKTESISYLTSDGINNAIVTSYNSGKAEPGVVYDLQKATSKDPYDIFLSGANALLTIDNNQVKNGKQLIIFRDSFGSALMPLLIDSYERITVVDIRYIIPKYLGNFINFTNQDVLFIYSTLLLNNSLSLQ